MYNKLVGGVLALNLEQLKQTNGYSNLYWGWGAEDDDMSMRIIHSGYKITRPTNKIGRFKMMLHKKRSRAENRFDLLTYWTRYKEDGLSSLKNLTYKIVDVTLKKYYTHIMIDIGPSSKEDLAELREKLKKAKYFFD